MYKNHKVFPINFQQQKPNSNKQAGMSALASKWVRLAPKETNQRLLRITFVHFDAKM